MRKPKDTRSQVVKFLDSVWNAKVGVPHSWERINHAMREALQLAICRFQFEPDDFNAVENGYGSGYWFDKEASYALAVICDNRSACESCEKMIGRGPIIADNVRLRPYGDHGGVHVVGDRQSCRLHVGCSFHWNGEQVTVTSFRGSAAIACAYNPDTYTFRKKVRKRFTITRDDVIADRAERKRREEILDELTKIDKDNGDDRTEEILQEIGVRTKVEFMKVPLKKLERVLAAEQSQRTTKGRRHEC